MRTVRIAAVFMMGLLLLTPAACGGGGGGGATPTATATANTVEGTSTIPADFLTYNDSSGLFSISYPPDWEVNLEIIPDLQTITEKLIDSIRSGVQLENVSMIFYAGVPYGLGYNPNVIIAVEPLPAYLHGIEAVAASAIIGIKMLADEYHEISRESTVIDGREAVIVEYEATAQGISVHNLAMFTVVGKTVWSIGCTTITGSANFSEHKADFESILRSLNIYD